MCHISHVMCQVSYVMCHFFVQSGGASRGRVCYQRGLPRVVFGVPEVIYTRQETKKGTERYNSTFFFSLST